MANLTVTAAELQAKLDRIDGNAKIFKKACLLGDSITGQHQVFIALPITGSQGFWNWANWLIGCPFDFCQNLGVSGDTAENIFARIWQIHYDIDTVFVLAGTNDIIGFSSASNQSQINAEIDRLIGTTGLFTLGLAALKTAGKKVCIGTIPPNNAINSSSDARIAVLDAVNTWILASKTAGRCTEVVDLFTAMWDSAQPTLRVFKTNYSYDGTHLTNLAGQAGGLAAVTATTSIYNQTFCKSYKLTRHQNTLSQISQMRTIAGVSATMTYGSGTLASGWRSLNSGSGTPTLVLDNTQNYAVGSNYVGPNTIAAPSMKWQKATITGAVAGSKIRFQLASAPVPNPGDELWGEMDIYVESCTGLSTVAMGVSISYASGTSPVDQAFGSTNNIRTWGNLHSTAQNEYEFPNNPFRIHVNSEPCRIPENINTTTALSLQYYFDIIFSNNGGAVVYFSKPQVWKKL